MARATIQRSEEIQIEETSLDSTPRYLHGTDHGPEILLSGKLLGGHKAFAGMNLLEAHEMVKKHELGAVKPEDVKIFFAKESSPVTPISYAKGDHGMIFTFKPELGEKYSFNPSDNYSTVVAYEIPLEYLEEIWLKSREDLNELIRVLGKSGKKLSAMVDRVWVAKDAFEDHKHTLSPGDYKKIDNSMLQQMEKQKKKCFLTTACVERRGLPDDCEELTVLRRFRDERMQRTEEGRALVAEYGRIAPALVERIGRHERAGEIYEYIYRVIRTCVDGIREGAPDEAQQAYVGMVRTLQAIL